MQNVRDRAHPMPEPKRYRLRWLSLYLVLAAGCASARPESAASAGPLKVAAGPVLLPFVRAAAATLNPRQKKLEPQVEEARNSTAIRKLTDGLIGMAFTTRAVRRVELGAAASKQRALHMVLVGAEALLVIVHPDNPLRDISSAQLQAVFFSGAIKDWSELTAGQKTGPIRALAVSAKSSSGELFTATLADDPKQPYLDSSQAAHSEEAAVAAVEDDPNAISFTDVRNLTSRVRVLSLNQVTHTPRAVLDDSYALHRKLFAVSDGPPRGSARALLRHMLGETGQRIADENGITPLALD